ncbi:MAG: hypothetical protein RIQ48_739 [Pseudomonadota bacterium]|jgi:hypothetical protein
MINLVLFTSTKGHFGNKQIYQRTIEDLFSKIDPNFFFKFAHIKVSPNEEKIAEEMQTFLSSLNFLVDKTIGNWSHSDHQSHAIGYTQDIIKSFSNDQLHKQQFSLWLEDDWLFNIKKNNLEYYINYAVEQLKINKDLLCFRFNHEIHEVDENNNINKDIYYLQTDKSTPYGSTFTFQPNITRTRDVWLAYKFISKYWDNIKNMHIELQSGWGLKHLTSNPNHFAFFNPQYIDCIHIGCNPNQ